MNKDEIKAELRKQGLDDSDESLQAFIEKVDASVKKAMQRLQLVLVLGSFAALTICYLLNTEGSMWLALVVSIFLFSRAASAFSERKAHAITCILYLILSGVMLLDGWTGFLTAVFLSGIVAYRITHLKEIDDLPYWKVDRTRGPK